MGRSRFFVGKNYQRGITLKLRKGKQLLFCAIHCLYLLHIPIKLDEDIMNSGLVIECTRMLITQNKHKAQSKGYSSEMKKAKAAVIVRSTLS